MVGIALELPRWFSQKYPVLKPYPLRIGLLNQVDIEAHIFEYLLIGTVGPIVYMVKETIYLAGAVRHETFTEHGPCVCGNVWFLETIKEVEYLFRES